MTLYNRKREIGPSSF